MTRKSKIIKYVSTLVLAVYTATAFAAPAITREDVTTAQRAWADCILEIGKTSIAKADTKAVALACIDTLYAYDHGGVLFKPTKASAKQFRLTKQDALSYFITGTITEDHGFALQPWSKIRFENANTLIDSDSAIAMGNYYFTDANSGQEVKVEYTFGYRKDQDGKLRINLHHSSVPYSPAH